MPSLSFEKQHKSDVPIAIVRGGEHKNKILYLHDDTITKGKSEGQKKISLKDGNFQLLPPVKEDQRHIYWITGQSGSGKSYIVKELAENYHKIFPDRNVFLISKLDEDETLDSLDFIKRIPISLLMEEKPSLEDFKDSFVIMDDYDSLPKDQLKVVQSIIDDIGCMGRHFNITMALCSHRNTDYSRTRLVLSEVSHCIVYPMSSSFNQLKHLVCNYMGVDEEDLKRHRRLGSRWICYKRSFPMYAISQKHAEILFVD